MVVPLALADPAVLADRDNTPAERIIQVPDREFAAGTASEGCGAVSRHAAVPTSRPTLVSSTGLTFSWQQHAAPAGSPPRARGSPGPKTRTGGVGTLNGLGIAEACGVVADLAAADNSRAFVSSARAKARRDPAQPRTQATAEALKDRTDGPLLTPGLLFDLPHMAAT